MGNVARGGFEEFYTAEKYIFWALESQFWSKRGSKNADFCTLWAKFGHLRGVGGTQSKNEFFAFSGVLFGTLQKYVYRIEKSSLVLILWTVQFPKSQGVSFVLGTLKLNNS